MISSASNPRIKHVVSLLKSSSDRRKENLFVVEGLRICREIPEDRIAECFISESFYNKCIAEGGLSSLDEYVFWNASTEIVKDDVFKKMSDTVSGQGVLCVVKQNEMTTNYLLEMKMSDSSRGGIKLLILESIQDPGNLGTMIRTAEAAGFDAIITDGATVDVFNPKVIRSTMGGIFRLPVIREDNFFECLGALKEKGITLYAALLGNESCDFREADYKGKIGILIGNEGNGLSEDAAKLADVHVTIPMMGEVESLNASVAASLMMYETLR